MLNCNQSYSKNNIEYKKTLYLNPLIWRLQNTIHIASALKGLTEYMSIWLIQKVKVNFTQIYQGISSIFVHEGQKYSCSCCKSMKTYVKGGKSERHKTVSSL